MTQLIEIHQENGAVMGERNGIAIPLRYSPAQEEHQAVRKNILLTDYSHFGIASISGEGAWELVNRVVGGDVSSIRDEQAMYTVILDDEGKIITDLYVLCDDERFLLLSEWLTGAALCELLQNKLVGNIDEFEEIEEIISLNDSWGTLHIEGPYSWELLAELYGMDVVGLPFQEHMHIDELVLLRSGKHGEFSYKLLGSRELLAEAWSQLTEAGEKFDLRRGGLDYQRLVRLENPTWDPNVFSDYSRSPIELQMQWTVRYDKEDFIGQAALSSELAQGVGHRAVGMMIDGKPDAMPARGDKIYLGQQQIGVVITCGYSDDLDAVLGRVLLENYYAWADTEAYEIQTATARIVIKTSAVPFARNYSFLVNPSEHSYVDPARPSDLLQQIEWQKEKDEQKKLAEQQKADELKNAETSAQDSDSAAL